jgi:hypothetical protein
MWGSLGSRSRCTEKQGWQQWDFSTSHLWPLPCTLPIPMGYDPMLACPSKFCFLTLVHKYVHPSMTVFVWTVCPLLWHGYMALYGLFPMESLGVYPGSQKPLFDHRRLNQASHNSLKPVKHRAIQINIVKKVQPSTAICQGSVSILMSLGRDSKWDSIYVIAPNYEWLPPRLFWKGAVGCILPEKKA